MNLQMSSCGSACWALSPSSLQHPHYTGVPCCPLMPAQVPHPPKGLVVCRSPCVKLRGWLIAFNPDCGGRALDFFEAKGTSRVTQLAELFSVGFRHELLYPVCSLSQALLCRAVHTTAPSSGGKCSLSPFWAGRISAQQEAQTFPPCTLCTPCRYTETRHGVSIPSEQRAHKLWCGRQCTYTEFKLLCRGYDLKNGCLGGQTTLLCLALKGHTVLISGHVFSPPALL